MTTHLNRKKIYVGQSLVESVITLGVVILLVTGLVIGTTSALSYAQDSRMRSLATQYAAEGLEIARRERDAGWTAFARSGSFCVDETALIPSEPCQLIGGRFTRMLTYTPDTSTTEVHQVIVTSVVYWVDRNAETKSISLQTTFTDWK